MSERLNTTKYPSTTVTAAAVSGRGDNALKHMRRDQGSPFSPKGPGKKEGGLRKRAHFAMLPA